MQSGGLTAAVKQFGDQTRNSFWSEKQWSRNLQKTLQS